MHAMHRDNMAGTQFFQRAQVFSNACARSQLPSLAGHLVCFRVQAPFVSATLSLHPNMISFVCLYPTTRLTAAELRVLVHKGRGTRIRPTPAQCAEGDAGEGLKSQ